MAGNGCEEGPGASCVWSFTCQLGWAVVPRGLVKFFFLLLLLYWRIITEFCCFLSDLNMKCPCCCESTLQMWLTSIIGWHSVKTTTLYNPEGTHGVVLRPQERSLRFPGKEGMLPQTCLRLQFAGLNTDFRLRAITSVLAWEFSLLPVFGIS